MQLPQDVLHRIHSAKDVKIVCDNAIRHEHSVTERKRQWIPQRLRQLAARKPMAFPSPRFICRWSQGSPDTPHATKGPSYRRPLVEDIRPDQSQKEHEEEARQDMQALEAEHNGLKHKLSADTETLQSAPKKPIRKHSFDFADTIEILGSALRISAASKDHQLDDHR